MLNLKVNNIISDKGNAIANQFEIEDYKNGITYFQSYKTIIAKIEGGKLSVDRQSWDYSRTTLKYLDVFLQDFNFSEIAGMNHDQKEQYFEENNCFEELN